MDKGGCIITYPVGGYRETAIKCAIRLGANKVILLNHNEQYLTLFNELKLSADVKLIPTDDVSSVVSSVANLIFDAKKDYGEVNVLLLSSDMIIGIGMYVAACMENVKALTPLSDFEMQFLTLPLFPFVNINENERFVLAKITENRETSTKNLFAKIKKEYCSVLCSGSRNSDSADKEKSAFRQLHRTLNKLEKMKLIRREKQGKNIMLNSTPLGILISGQGNREK